MIEETTPRKTETNGGMHQSAHSLAKLIANAERELSAFFSAVAQLFGPKEATRAAKDWLQQLEGMKTLPASPRQLRRLSIDASARLAKRVNSQFPNGGTSQYTRRHAMARSKGRTQL